MTKINLKQIRLNSLDSELKRTFQLKKNSVPPSGWLNTIRTALGISLEQLSKKLHRSKQSIWDAEQREKDGSITINALREIADAMEMELVYTLIPKSGSINALLEQKAEKLAREIVMRTHTTMTLEDQAISDEELEKAIRRKTEQLKLEMPKALWQ